MSPEQWFRVKDNPIQRDTVAHAEYAQVRHLRKASTSQEVVHAARLPDGTMFKLDGHTRALMWLDGRLKPPSTVHVVVHKVESCEEAIEKYKEFDSASAAEGAADRLSGAFRLHDIAPRNRLLSKGGVTTALSIIAPSRDVYDMVGDWRDELIALDELEATPEQMAASLICAALLTIRRRGKKAMEFWRLYVAGAGTRIGGRSCGIDQLSRTVSELRARKSLSRGSMKDRKAHAGRAISCCEAWVHGREFSGPARETDVDKYMDAIDSERVVANRNTERAR